METLTIVEDQPYTAYSFEEVLSDSVPTPGNELCIALSRPRAPYPNEKTLAEVVKTLLNAGVDIKGNGTAIPLVIAAEKNHRDCIKILLDAGADPEQHIGGVTALVAAIKNGHPHMVRMLIRHGANVNAHHGLPMHTALLGFHHEIMGMLVKAGADPKDTIEYVTREITKLDNFVPSNDHWCEIKDKMRVKYTRMLDALTNGGKA
jgi:hypothetical protein